MKSEKQKPVKSPQLLHLSEAAAQAVADYKQYVMDNSNIMLSTQKAINALIMDGWQSQLFGWHDNREAARRAVKRARSKEAQS